MVDTRREWIEVHYPMVEHGITRADAAETTRKAGWPRAMKSGCFCCPFQPVSHYWAISRLWRGLYERSLAMEQAARAHNAKLTLTGKPLEEAVGQWARQHRPLPDPWEVLTEGFTQAVAWA
jgi:hypothetical protein